MVSPTFESTYADLPERFYARIPPTPVSAPRLLRLNPPLAASLGLDADWLSSPDGVAMLAGNALPDGLRPLAMVYAGHQFGNFVPQLGDGRAILLGECVDPEGRRFDVQLKGSGPTPFSRRGDGRAAIGPVLREYVVSEAMAALGVPTTRALAAVATGDPVHRDTTLPGAILTRISRGHLRVGTFEFFASRRDDEGVRALADYAIARLHPDAARSDAPHLAFFGAVVDAQAELVARWLGIGFVHGVMNTDNTSIAGETIDYGPCAFLDDYQPGQVFSSIDHGGRYAYGRQPGIAAWNLARLAETLLPLFGADQESQIAAAQGVLDRFEATFRTRWHEILTGKIGLERADEDDVELAGSLLDLMAEQKADFTRTFRGLAGLLEDEEPERDAAAADAAGFADPNALSPWADRWRARIAREGRSRLAVQADLRATNPALIPRNHRVEQAIAAAVDGDLAPFDRLVDALAAPYDDDPRFADLTRAPEPEEVVHQTFCGT